MLIKNKKVPIIVYSLLLVIVLPLTVYSVYLHYEGYGIGKERDRNVNKLFKFEGKLYFYDEDILVGTYTCKTTDCDGMKNQIKGLYNNRYAFITDGGVTMLYDALGDNEVSKVVGEFNGVKNYTAGLAKQRFIVMSKDNLWGVIDLSGSFPNLIISYKYNYIGLKKALDEDEKLYLQSNRYVAYDGANWKIINDRDTILSVNITEPIRNYDDNSIITLNNNVYRVYDYNQHKILENDYKFANYINNYILLVDFSNIVYLYNKSSGNVFNKGNIMDVSSIDVKGTDVYYDGELQFSI